MAAGVGVDPHAAELVEGELTFSITDPPLAEERWATAVEANREGHPDQDRAEEEDQRQGEDDVDTAPQGGGNAALAGDSFGRLAVSESVGLHALETTVASAEHLRRFL